MSESNKIRRRYSTKFKESVLKRLEPPTNYTVASLAEELNIYRTSIYSWIRNEKNKLDKAKSSNRWTLEDKFHAVLETSSLSEQELASYCRRKGLFTEDIKSWRDQCIRANAINSKDPLKLEEDLREERQRSKILEKELRRKEKALAEAAALLVLRKKSKRF
jgi:transposase